MLESWKMKKLLAIILFTIFWSSNLFADCYEDLKLDWEFIGSKTQAKFTWKNYSDKYVTVNRYGLRTADKKWVKEINTKIYMKPFGVSTRTFFVTDVNLEVVKFGSWNCSYDTAPKKKTNILKTKPKQKSGAQKWLDKIRGN